MFREMRFNNWYPDNEAEIRKFLPEVKHKKNVLAMIAPHAGWLYSGKTAGIVYAAANVSDTYIILCPNHTGLGSEIAVYPSDAWETPLGNLEVDSELADIIINKSEYAEADITAHIMEHSIEVHLPFIKAINPSAKIVPICMMTQDYKKCEDLGKAIFESLKEVNKKVNLVASTDMSHYSNVSIAKICDDMAIEQILKIDPVNLFNTVEEKNISMCGVSPATAALVNAKLAGASDAKLLRYSNSGEISGDFSEVVGYAGIIVY